jgi:hypothetical protein
MEKKSQECTRGCMQAVPGILSNFYNKDQKGGGGGGWEGRLFYSISFSSFIFLWDLMAFFFLKK